LAFAGAASDSAADPPAVGAGGGAGPSREWDLRDSAGARAGAGAGAPRRTGEPSVGARFSGRPGPSSLALGTRWGGGLGGPSGLLASGLPPAGVGVAGGARLGPWGCFWRGAGVNPWPRREGSFADGMPLSP